MEKNEIIENLRLIRDCFGNTMPDHYETINKAIAYIKDLPSSVPFSDGLDKRKIIGRELAELWPELKRATQLDIINRIREQPKAILDPIHLQILEAALKDR